MYVSLQHFSLALACWTVLLNSFSFGQAPPEIEDPAQLKFTIADVSVANSISGWQSAFTANKGSKLVIVTLLSHAAAPCAFRFHPCEFAALFEEDGKSWVAISRGASPGSDGNSDWYIADAGDRTVATVFFYPEKQMMSMRVAFAVPQVVTSLTIRCPMRIEGTAKDIGQLPQAPQPAVNVPVPRAAPPAPRPMSAAKNVRELRTWTSTVGTTIEATFDSRNGNKVTLLKADGTRVPVLLDQLSPEDRKVIVEYSR